MALVASILQPTILRCIEEMEKANQFADLIEIRLDALRVEEFNKLDWLKQKACLPLLFTFRKKEQGGHSVLEEKERLQQLEKTLTHSPAYVDVEWDTDKEFILACQKKFPTIQWIGSHHNFDGMPEDLESFFKTVKRPYFQSYKMVFKSHSSLDTLRLMLFAKQQSQQVSLSCIAIGQKGKFSRLMGPLIGNQFDYAGIEENLFLGRDSLERLVQVFHYHSLHRQTPIYALIGNPVEHSQGDLFHNKYFQGKALYIKIEISKEELSSFLLYAKKLSFQGLSVTMPLKEEILPFVVRDPDANKIQAVNTLLSIGDSWLGLNTDGQGALNAIEKHVSVFGKNIAILGAGGAASAIGFEAHQRGAQVAFFHRNLEKAKKKAILCGGKGYFLQDLVHFPYQIIINTIPLDQPSLFASIPLRGYAMDVVYSPQETLFLRKAKDCGCALIYGIEMFQEQAFLQQNIWKNGNDGTVNKLNF